MARKSLRPHLNQIRGWVRQGRTDAWVAHQLEVPVQEITEFKRHNDLSGDGEAAEANAFSGEIDMRAEDDARIAAELEAAALQAEKARAEREAREAQERERARLEGPADAESDAGSDSLRSAESGASAEDGDSTAGESESRDRPRARRRSRRGGRSRRGSAHAGAPLEGTFDHGEEGYGLWLDPAIQDDPVYAEHWAGHRPIQVTVEEEQIVIRRIGDS